jgi:hypothetical protein
MTGRETTSGRVKLSLCSLFVLYGVVALALAALFPNVLLLAVVLLPLAMYMDKVTYDGNFFIPWKRPGPSSANGLASQPQSSVPPAKRSRAHRCRTSE